MRGIKYTAKEKLRALELWLTAKEDILKVKKNLNAVKEHCGIGNLYLTVI